MPAENERERIAKGAVHPNMKTHSSSPPPDDIKSADVSKSTEQFWSFTAAFCSTTDVNGVLHIKWLHTA